MDKSQASTEETKQFTDLSLAKMTCKHCLVMKDTFSQLIIIKKGRADFLHCNICQTTYCDFCLNKIVVRKNGYHYCYRCYRRIKKLFVDGKTISHCQKDGCIRDGIIEGCIYNPDKDMIITGIFCKKHYQAYYYYIKQKTSPINRVSFGKRKHSRKTIIKRDLLYNKNVRNKKEFQESIDSF